MSAKKGFSMDATPPPITTISGSSRSTILPNHTDKSSIVSSQYCARRSVAHHAQLDLPFRW